ncbi:glycoside hydrolase family 25 protein [Actinomyces culturomici]|uniref:glycoside hydrolase family 25 protein n=1 Tax=Actinomyces culturomici TaxID=1926276 RepID=UPI000E2059FA|nr:glycoside hydrolase family 25 protein [Actinomyces culturomici]
MRNARAKIVSAALCAVAAFALANPSASAADPVVESLPATAAEQAGAPELPEVVSPSIADDDLLVSDDLVMTPEGDVKDVRTGEVVTDPAIVGTPDAPPDPLAKTDGRRFIPVEVGELRAAESSGTGETSDGSGAGSQSSQDARESGAASAAPSASRNLVGADGAFAASPAAFSSSPSAYGAYWGTYLGEPAFFDGKGRLFAQQATTVIDVSQWQGTIDWSAVKRSGVDAAIIRLGYSDTGIDTKVMTNISECKRLGIPFGVYLFSYAENATDGANEAKHVLALLRQAGVKPSDLAYPVFYDLERWSYTGASSPTTTKAYESIVGAWWSTMTAAGYERLSLYSYTDMLKNELNSSSLHAKTMWAASYGATVDYAYPANYRGWQYTSEQRVQGITENVVDVSAFGNGDWTTDVNLTWFLRDEDIAVGASLAKTYAKPVEYRFQEYDVAAGKWRTFADWTGANWAGWASTAGTYWLHVEARDASTHKTLGTQTIAFAYKAGTTRITGTFAGWRSDGILLGAVSNNPKATTRIKIYDTATKQWVADFKGPWALWHPKKGVYWTHFEVYTSDGRLAQTLTYAFGV